MPALSVVIPTFRRHELLGRVLDQLGRQRGAGAFEVVVVDDPEHDDPSAVRRAVGSRAYPVRQLSRTARGVAAARNRGWRAAEAPIVLFLGDDMIPSEDLLARHQALHDHHPSEEVGALGHIVWSSELEVSDFMRWLDRGIQFDYARIKGPEAGWTRFYTGNLSMKKTFLSRVDGFDEGFEFGYEDLDLGKRLDALGLRLLYEPDALVEHLHEPTLEGWHERMALIAPAERRFVARHPEHEPYFYLRCRAVLEGRPIPKGGSLKKRLFRMPPSLARLAGGRAGDRYLEELAPSFLDSWSAARAEDGLRLPWDDLDQLPLGGLPSASSSTDGPK